MRLHFADCLRSKQDLQALSGGEDIIAFIAIASFLTVCILCMVFGL